MTRRRSNAAFDSQIIISLCNSAWEISVISVASKTLKSYLYTDQLLLVATMVASGPFRGYRYVAFKSSPERDKSSLTAFYRFPNKTDLYKRFCSCQLVPTRARGMMTARELTQLLRVNFSKNCITLNLIDCWFIYGHFFV